MKCNYCDFEYETKDKYYEHLNQKHFRCICGKVCDSEENDETALCKECLESEEDIFNAR